MLKLVILAHSVKGKIEGSEFSVERFIVWGERDCGLIVDGIPHGLNPEHAKLRIRHRIPCCHIDRNWKTEANVDGKAQTYRDAQAIRLIKSREGLGSNGLQARVAEAVLQEVWPNIVQRLERNASASPRLEQIADAHHLSHELVEAVVALTEIHRLVRCLFMNSLPQGEGACEDGGRVLLIGAEFSFGSHNLAILPGQVREQWQARSSSTLVRRKKSADSDIPGQPRDKNARRRAPEILHPIQGGVVVGKRDEVSSLCSSIFCYFLAAFQAAGSVPRQKTLVGLKTLRKEERFAVEAEKPIHSLLRVVRHFAEP